MHEFSTSRRVFQQRTCVRTGGMLVLVAFLLPVLLAIVGFSVDLANMQRVRTELRAATDLSSKAAAHALSLATVDDPDYGTVEARSAANAVAAANRVSGQPLQFATSDFVFGRSVKQGGGNWLFAAGATPFNSVKLTGRRTASSLGGAVSLNFGGLYGQPTFEPTTTATSSFRVVDICLVLDRSSSMKLSVDDPAGLMSGGDPRTCQNPYSDSRWIALETAVNIFATQLEQSAASEYLALVTFAGGGYAPCGETNTTVSTDQGLTSNITSVRDAMWVRSNSIWNGMTDIEAGIQRATSVLTSSPARASAEKVMIVFTDGVYTEDDPEDAAEDANDDGITIHTITFSNGANQDDMQDVAEAGGGASYHAPDAATLSNIFFDLAGSIAILTE